MGQEGAQVARGYGGAHWVAVRGNDAESRSVLVHWNRGRERMLRDYAALAQGAGARTPPQLVRDAGATGDAACRQPA